MCQFKTAWIPNNVLSYKGNTSCRHTAWPARHIPLHEGCAALRLQTALLRKTELGFKSEMKRWELRVLRENKRNGHDWQLLSKLIWECSALTDLWGLQRHVGHWWLAPQCALSSANEPPGALLVKTGSRGWSAGRYLHKMPEKLRIYHPVVFIHTHIHIYIYISIYIVNNNNVT